MLASYIACLWQPQCNRQTTETNHFGRYGCCVRGGSISPLPLLPPSRNAFLLSLSFSPSFGPSVCPSFCPSFSPSFFSPFFLPSALPLAPPLVLPFVPFVLSSDLTFSVGRRRRRTARTPAITAAVSNLAPPASLPIPPVLTLPPPLLLRMCNRSVIFYRRDARSSTVSRANSILYRWHVRALFVDLAPTVPVRSKDGHTNTSTHLVKIVNPGHSYRLVSTTANKKNVVEPIAAHLYLYVGYVHIHDSEKNTAVVASSRTQEKQPLSLSLWLLCHRPEPQFSFFFEH